MNPLVTTPGRKLKIIQAHDPLKHWWSLDEMRHCKKCEQLFPGRDIKVYQDEEEGPYSFHCPNPECEATWADWEYPDLHL